MNVLNFKYIDMSEINIRDLPSCQIHITVFGKEKLHERNVIRSLAAGR